MPGAAGQLKKLYQQIIGGVAPSSSASSSGDIAAMVKYLVANLPSPAAPLFMSTVSPECLGTQIAARAMGAPASAAWGNANDAIFLPFTLQGPITVVKLWCVNGATVAGNLDMGIYDSSGTRLVSIGSTAQAGTSAVQEFDIADTVLAAGRYYIALSHSDGTSTVALFTAPAAGGYWKSLGVAFQATAHPLPSTATLAVQNSSQIPLIGWSARTLVA